MKVCKYVGIHIYASLPVCNYASMHIYAGMHIYKSMQYASMKILSM